MGADFQRGDRVKVTIEGTVNRVLNFDGTQELRIDADGLDNYVYTDAAKVEKVEPEVETFGPGDVVKAKPGIGLDSYARALSTGGYTILRLGDFHSYGNDLAFTREDFTSERFERVEVG